MTLKKTILKTTLAAAVALSNVAFADQDITITTGTASGTVFNTGEVSIDTTVGSTAFAAADAGGVVVETSRPGVWLAALPSASAAKWVGADADSLNNNSMLFAFPFTVTDVAINSATIQIAYAVDDRFGFGSNGGIYINKIPAVGTNSTGQGFNSEKNTSVIDITTSVQTGANVLYLYVRDFTHNAGLIARANIKIKGLSVAVTNVPNANSGNQGALPLTGTCTASDGDVTVTVPSATPATQTVACSATGTWTATVDVTAIPNGTGVIAVTASQTDGAGNTKTSATVRANKLIPSSPIPSMNMLGLLLLNVALISLVFNRIRKKK